MKVKINGRTHIRKELKNGTVEYHCDGWRELYHREDDGPAIITIDKDFFWYKRGLPHRKNGPAFEFSCGEKHWFKNGMRHRLDGPAIECPSGLKEWWIEDKQYTEEQFNNLTKEK